MKSHPFGLFVISLSHINFYPYIFLKNNLITMLSQKDEDKNIVRISRRQEQHGGYQQHLQAWVTSRIIRVRRASEISLEISICNVSVLIVATGLPETMYVFVSAEVRHGISTKVSSVFSAPAGAETFSFLSSYACFRNRRCQ